jgi:hypothetical protein
MYPQHTEPVVELYPLGLGHGLEMGGATGAFSRRREGHANQGKPDCGNRR